MIIKIFGQDYESVKDDEKYRDEDACYQCAFRYEETHCRAANLNNEKKCWQSPLSHYEEAQ